MSPAAPGLEGLLAVQDHDTELDQLRHRRATLPQRVVLAERRGELELLEGDAATTATERAALEERRTALDREVNELTARLQELDRRLRSGEVTATRDLTAMVDQRDSLARRRGELEDAELELLMAEEPLDEALAAHDRRRAELVADMVEAERELARAEAAIDAELGTAAEARAAAAAGIEPGLLATYERLRQRLGGVGAARLVGSSCSGCHLSLPATELDRIRHLPPDALVTCDQCGRILVR